MSALHTWMDVLVPLLYVAAWGNYALFFFRDPPFSRRTASPLLAVAAAAHGTGIVSTALAHHRCPLGNLPEILSVLAFGVVAVYLLLERRQRNKYSGMFLLTPVVPIMIVVSSLAPALQAPPDLLRSPLFGLHTTMALLGYASFLVCTVYGVMYLLLYRTLKARAFGLVFHRLPSLDGLAGMAVGAATMGFLALTATITLGLVWGSQAPAGALLPHGLWGDPKIGLTLLVWAAYGAGIATRYVFRWSNRPTMVLFLCAFVVAVLTVVALHTVLPTFHDFTRITRADGA